MKIIINSFNFYPELIGIGPYSYDMAQYLSVDNEITVLTTFPYYPEWKKSEKYKGKYFYKEKLNNYTIQRILTYVPQKPNSLTRIIHELIYSLLSFFYLLFKKKPDVIICVTPPFFNMITTSVVCKIKKIPLVIHIQDLQPDAAFDLGMLKGKILVKILYSLEISAYKNARLICCIGNKMRERVLKKDIGEKNIQVIKNWYRLYPAENKRTFRSLHNLEREYLVLYSGNIGKKQGLDVLIETAKIALTENSDIKFLIAGDGAYKKELEEEAKLNSLSNVLFLNVQTEEKFIDMLNSVDISLILQKKEVIDIVVPSKLLNILSFGSPLIAAVNEKSETAEILRELPFGVVIEPENPRALFKKIMEMKNNSSVVKELRLSEIELANRVFKKESQLSKLKSYINQI